MEAIDTLLTNTRRDATSYKEREREKVRDEREETGSGWSRWEILSFLSLSPCQKIHNEPEEEGMVERRVGGEDAALVPCCTSIFASPVRV